MWILYFSGVNSLTKPQSMKLPKPTGMQWTCGFLGPSALLLWPFVIPLWLKWKAFTSKEDALKESRLIIKALPWSSGVCGISEGLGRLQETWPESDMVPSLWKDLMVQCRRSESPIAGRDGMLIFTWTEKKKHVKGFGSVWTWIFHRNSYCL